MLECERCWSGSPASGGHVCGLSEESRSVAGPYGELGVVIVGWFDDPKPCQDHAGSLLLGMQRYAGV